MDITVKNLKKSFNISPITVLYCILFVVLAYILYCIILAGLSSLATSIYDANIGQIITLCILPVCFNLVIFSLSKPAQLKILSLIPFSAPFGMTARILISSTVTNTEVLLSITLLIITIAVAGYLSSKLFKRGILKYSGKKSRIKGLK